MSESSLRQQQRRRRFAAAADVFFFFAVVAAAVVVATVVPSASAFSATPTTSTTSNGSNGDDAREIIRNYGPRLLDPILGTPRSDRPIFPPSASPKGRKHLVAVLPQLGEFDSSELCEHLIGASDALKKNGVELIVIGIGEPEAGRRFLEFTGLDPEVLWLDPNAELHEELDLYSGPGFTVPDDVPDSVLRFFLRQLPGEVPSDDKELRSAAEAWLNYNAMCAGIGAPGTLREILRGYLGDRTAPERFRDDDVVEAGFVTIGPGVGPTSIGPLKYDQWFSDERGYQRPVELATVRLKNLVEVLTRWDEYVTDVTTIPRRGGIFLFDDDDDDSSEGLLYSHRSKGVLTYSETMPRPLSFLAPYLGEEKDVAFNALGLPDTGYGDSNTRGRGILKPAGKLMGFLSPLFRLETRLQAFALGAREEPDFAEARRKIDSVVVGNDSSAAADVVVYGYSLSPFTAEALAILDDEEEAIKGDIDIDDDIEIRRETITVGLEWFLLGREGSAIRAELMNRAGGQSSLPQVFVGGVHVGGLATGTPDGRYPGGLAALKESGKLREMMIRSATASAKTSSAETTTTATSTEATATTTTTSKAEA